MTFKSKSSHVDHVKYDQANKTLIVTFRNGTTYHYNGVSLLDYTLFKNAKSHGKHLSSFIKDRFNSVLQPKKRGK